MSGKRYINMCMNNEGEYGKYFMQDLILPTVMDNQEAREKYRAKGRRRILWIDSNNMDGANFQMNCAWIVHADREIQLTAETDGTEGMRRLTHYHDTDELIGFLGSNPDDPSDLCGEIEFHVEGEIHILTRSTFIFMPAGMKHFPMYMNRIDRPVFHFSQVFGANYHMNLSDGSIYRAE